MNFDFLKISYIIASIFFILSLKGLSAPNTAVRGNLLGIIGMFAAVVATFLDLDYFFFTNDCHFHWWINWNSYRKKS